MAPTLNTTQLVVNLYGQRRIANDGRVTELDTESMVGRVASEVAEKYNYALGKRILLSRAGNKDHSNLLIGRLQDYLLEGSLNHDAPLNLMAAAQEIGERYPAGNDVTLILSDSGNLGSEGCIIMAGKPNRGGYRCTYADDVDGIGSGGSLAAEEFERLLRNAPPRSDDEIPMMMYTAIDNIKTRDERSGGVIRINSVSTTGHWISTRIGFIYNPIPRINYYHHP